jgi:alginate O-acetyltransferase complex protein AlgI
VLFNSITFAVFLPIVTILYWFIFNKSLRFQNLLLLVASYVFYGWWDWRFLSLIFISSLSDFIIGHLMDKKSDKLIRKLLIWSSLLLNLGLLAFFKYFNFFVDSAIELGQKLGLQLHESTLNIILPVGISFYTFQTLSYTIDIYRKKIKPTSDIISFFAFVSFFPQLVAGPIERASHLLPQFQKPRVFDLAGAKDGLRQILWGLIKKVVIADTIGIQVNQIFDSASFTSTPGITLIVGSVLFTFQIYCDFSGYSDIAIGTARLFGFDLMRNFAYPFFSRNIGELWQRWHISLTTWFRDYVFIPLGGNRVSQSRLIINIMITFTISGLWHGANWTFIFWGALNGLFYLPVLLLKNKGKFNSIVAVKSIFPNIKELFQIILTFTLFSLTMIFFRSKNIESSFDYIHSLISNINMNFIIILQWLQDKSIIMIIILVIVEWLQRRKSHALEVHSYPVIFRWIIYIISMAIFIYFGEFGGKQQFIYFQF